MTAKHTRHEPLETYLEKIEGAKVFISMIERGDDPAKWYRRFAKICHPDVVPAHYKARATKAFAKMSQLYAELTKPAAPARVVIAGYVVTGAFAKGDIADLHLAECDKGPKAAILKIVRSQADNDLMEREAAALKAIKTANLSTGAVQRLTHKFSDYVPDIHASVKASGRRVNIISHAEEFTSLESIVALTRGRLDFRHAVWMGNRALSLLGYVHRLRYVHGAVIPSHMLYDLATHNFQLVDWCYSCTKDQRVPAVAKDYKYLYPPEVAKKMYPTPGTDLFMLMQALRSVVDNVPKRFKSLMDWCVAGPPASRPADAWHVQDRWVALAEEEYGPAKFVELKLTSH